MTDLNNAGRDVDSVSMDDKIMAQREAIEQDVARTQPLVGKKAAIVSLANEYDITTSATYHSKAVALQEKYAEIRRVRGDGNCFYRAVAFSLCEMCLNRPNVLNEKLALLDKWQKVIEELGYSSVAITDFFDCFREMLEDIKNGMDEIGLLKKFNESYYSNYAVVCLRLITTGYMRKNATTFEGFIDNNISLEEYCEREVQPMNRECDHVSILALISALELSALIEYMDRSDSGINHCVNVDENKTPLLFFLYRPGHYDILYPVEK